MTTAPIPKIRILREILPDPKNPPNAINIPEIELTQTFNLVKKTWKYAYYA